MDPEDAQLVVIAVVAVAVVWAVDYVSLDGIVALALVGATVAVAFVPLRSVGPSVRALGLTTNADGRVAVVAVGGFVLAVVLTNVLGDPTLTCDIDTTRWCTTRYGFGMALALVGSLAVPIVAGNLGHYRRLGRGGDATTAPASGAVVVAGTAVAAGESLESPVDETRSLCRRIHVDVRGGGRLREQRWYPVTVVEAAVPFYVETRDGRILVDPTKGDLDVSTAPDSVERVIEADDPVSGSLRDVIDEDGRDRRVREQRLVPGSDVCVVGDAVEVSRSDYEDSPVVGGDGAPVLVATGPQRAVERLLRRRVVGAGVVGLAFGVVGYTTMVLASV